MAEVTSRTNATVIVLDEDEATALVNILSFSMRDPRVEKTCTTLFDLFAALDVR